MFTLFRICLVVTNITKATGMLRDPPGDAYTLGKEGKRRPDVSQLKPRPAKDMLGNAITYVNFVDIYRHVFEFLCQKVRDTDWWNILVC